MVSLDGDLADTSGAMHGGFRQKTNAAFKEVDVDKGANQLERNVTELTDALTVHEKTRLENESSLTKMREFKSTLEGEIIKAEKSLHLDAGDG